MTEGHAFRSSVRRLGLAVLATVAVVVYLSLAQPPVSADPGCVSNNCNQGVSCGDGCHCEFPACYTNPG